ncbi:hypothetical protein AMECASPLE_031845 [Ameca splendens]|uniref:Uncharacterized protein n=1 Tax=Ameca splendens TaxID=208324 RepID=A0ABV0XJL3_9TELE
MAEEDETNLSETAPGESEWEGECNRSGTQWEAGEDEQCDEELQSTCMEDLHPAPQEDNTPVPQAEHPVPLRKSIRERWPGPVFTYPSLGQPVYQPRSTVNAVGIQPTLSMYQSSPSLYLHPIQPPSISPYPYLPVVDSGIRSRMPWTVAYI